MAFPVSPFVRSSLLDGQTNGKLSPKILETTPGQKGGPTVVLVKPAARSWRALCAAAKKAGHILKASSVADSYRVYEIQERIFLQRYTTTYLPGRPYKIWRGKRWYQKPGTAVAAVPGTSNHGWASAVDTGEERDSDADTESLDDPTLRWLIANERTYGWSHELQSEPWHLRYFAGDRIPPAVLAYETTLATPPTSTIEALEGEHSMTLVVVEGAYTLLHLGGREYLPLTPAFYLKLTQQGVPVITVTNNEFQAASPFNNPDSAHKQGSLLRGLSYG
jgi:hypothetical protein